jgi:hypothetical protein
LDDPLDDFGDDFLGVIRWIIYRMSCLRLAVVDGWRARTFLEDVLEQNKASNIALMKT